MCDIQNVRLTTFAINSHFDPNRPGTTILDRVPGQFEAELNDIVMAGDLRVLPGYEDFCKLLFVENWTDASVGAMEIVESNRHLLHSGYHARRESELPVLTRWFEASAPRAEFLCIVLYSAEQMLKERSELWTDDAWAVVAILGQSHNNEEPMPPVTMMRNALGVEEGGSGVSLDREAYQRSVDFWDKHAVVKGV